MSDQALDWMVNTLQTTDANDKSFVWCTDENAINGIPRLPHSNFIPAKEPGFADQH